MVSGDYVLGMTSLLDTEEGFDRLAEALLEIDRCACGTGMNRGRALHQAQEVLLAEKNQEDAAGQTAENTPSRLPH